MQTITQSCPTYTPWGVPDITRELAPGVFIISTPSHGGVYVAGTALACIPEVFQKATFTRSPNWYEEDCDWVIPAYFLPAAFPTEDRDRAEAATEPTPEPEPESVAPPPTPMFRLEGTGGGGSMRQARLF